MVLSRGLGFDFGCCLHVCDCMVGGYGLLLIYILGLRAMYDMLLLGLLLLGFALRACWFACFFGLVFDMCEIWWVYCFRLWAYIVSFVMNC